MWPTDKLREAGAAVLRANPDRDLTLADGMRLALQASGAGVCDDDGQILVMIAGEPLRMDLHYRLTARQAAPAAA